MTPAEAQRGHQAENGETEALRREIEAFHAAAIGAHRRGDVEALVSDQSDDFVSISNGQIRCPTIDETRKGLEAYLGNTRFSEYRLLQEPIVGFSEDRTVAWSSVEMRVAGERDTAGGEVVRFDTIWAWVTVFRRKGMSWERIVESSSWRPGSESS